MRSVSVRLDDLRTMILNIGFVGENEHKRFIFDCKKMFDQYPHAAASMTVQPPEGEAYPAIVERDGDFVIWDVTDSDLTYEGDGELQLAFTAEPHVAKSYIARTKISRSIVPTGEVPSGIDDFLTRAGAALTAIPETIDTALEEAKESGEFDGPAGPKGDKGDPGERGPAGPKGDPGDPGDVIDDTAGAGDTDKTWSADKLTEEISKGSVFIVTITKSGSTYSSDKTYAEIVAAADENREVYAVLVDNDRFSLTYNDYYCLSTINKLSEPSQSGYYLYAEFTKMNGSEVDRIYISNYNGVNSVSVNHISLVSDLNFVAPDYAYMIFPIAAGTPCTYHGGYYVAKVDIPTQEEFNSSHWNAPFLADEINSKAEIDDEAGAGDTDKTFSADKLTEEFGDLKNDLTQIDEILDMQEGSGGIVFTGDQSDDYKIQIQVSTLAVIDSSKNHSLKANVTGNTNITIVKDYSTRFVITTFATEPALGVIGIRRIDNAASVLSYDMVLADGENWLLITYFNDDEDASRNVTTVKNSFVITSEEAGEAYSHRIDTIEEKTNNSFSALGLEGSVNLFDPNGDSANLMMTINQGSQVYTTSSKVHGMYCEIPSGTTFTVSKPKTSRFVIGTSVAKPVAGGALTQIVDVSSSRVSYTLTSGANDKYFFMAYYHNDEDASKNIDTIIAGIKVFVGTVWREGMSNFLHPLSAMPGYMTKLLSYKPLGTLTKPYICLSCDDGESTLATDTIPALKGYKTTYGQNIPVTFGLLDTSAVVTNDTYKALVQEMVSDYGCSVAVHGAVTLTDLDEIGLQEELKKQKDALTTAGFTPNGIIYPQHSFNDLVCAVAGGQYGVCCTGGNYTDLTYGDGNACGYRSNMYALYRLSLFNSSMTTQKIHDYVDYIETNKMLMCAFWHDSAFSANHALLDELVSYAVGKGIDFITIGDILTIV